MHDARHTYTTLIMMRESMFGALCIKLLKPEMRKGFPTNTLTIDDKVKRKKLRQERPA